MRTLGYCKVVCRLADLVILGIRLQVDLVPELGVPIDKKNTLKDGSVNDSFTVRGRHDRCGEVRPGMLPVSLSGEACSAHGTSRRDIAPSTLRHSYSFDHDPQSYHKPADHDPHLPPSHHHLPLPPLNPDTQTHNSIFNPFIPSTHSSRLFSNRRISLCNPRRSRDS